MKKGFGTGLMSSMRNSRAWVIGVMLVAMAPFVFGGCYGSFPLTKKIYAYNGNISDDQTIQSVTFWAFVILPVYEIAMIGDAVIFNLVEFWTGDQLLSVGPTTDSNGSVVCLTPTADGREALLTVSRDGRVIAQESFVKVSDTVLEVRDAEGNLDGKVLKAPDGTITLTDSKGSVVRTLPAGALGTM